MAASEVISEGASATGDELRGLAAAARLLGGLLLRELTRERLDELQDPRVATLLAACGLELPEVPDRAALDELASDFFNTFVSPTTALPLVQSLVEEGTYEGRAALELRAVAQACGLDHDAGASRGAAVDHLGSELELWAFLAERDAQAAGAFRDRYLLWAPAVLRRFDSSGFHADLLRVTADFIEILPGTSGSDASS